MAPAKCTREILNGPIVEVAFYVTAANFIEGIQFIEQPMDDGVFPGPTISAGLVEQTGQTRYAIVFPRQDGGVGDYNFDFWGFITLRDSQGRIDELQVVTYDKDIMYRNIFDRPEIVQGIEDRIARSDDIEQV